MSTHVLSRNGRSNLRFNGQLVAHARVGTDFLNTAYEVYEVDKGGFVINEMHWNGRMSNEAPDGTLISNADYVKDYSEAIKFLSRNGEASEAAINVLVEAGMIPDEVV